MKATEGGRVTPEQLDELDHWANRHPRPWTMGVSNYVVAAMVAEIREHRAEAREGDGG